MIWITEAILWYLDGFILGVFGIYVLTKYIQTYHKHINSWVSMYFLVCIYKHVGDQYPQNGRKKSKFIVLDTVILVLIFYMLIL